MRKVIVGGRGGGALFPDCSKDGWSKKGHHLGRGLGILDERRLWSTAEGKVFDKFPLPLPRHKDDAFFVKHDALAVFLRFNPPLFFFFYLIDCIQCFIYTSYNVDVARNNIIIFRNFPIFWKFFTSWRGSFIEMVQSIYVQWRTWLMEKYFLPFVPHFIVRSTIIRSVFSGLLIVPLCHSKRFALFSPLNIVQKVYRETFD